MHFHHKNLINFFEACQDKEKASCFADYLSANKKYVMGYLNSNISSDNEFAVWFSAFCQGAREADKKAVRKKSPQYLKDFD